MPAQAGIQSRGLDSRFRGSDGADAYMVRPDRARTAEPRLLRRSISTPAVETLRREGAAPQGDSSRLWRRPRSRGRALGEVE